MSCELRAVPLFGISPLLDWLPMLYSKGRNIDMPLLVEKRNSWRNLSDPFMHEAYDPSNPTKYIIYLDANNLYGWAMCQPLPNGGFKWMQLRCLAEGLTDFDDWQDFLVSLKLILSIRKSHTLFTTIIPFPLRG